MVIRLIRKAVYELGFRPQLGSVFFSPTLDLYYATANIGYWVQKGFENAMGRPYSEDDYDRDRAFLESMMREKNISPGIIVSVHQPSEHVPSPEEILKEIEDITKRDWFQEAPHKGGGDSRKLFFCPLCGRPLDFSTPDMCYICVDHGGFDFMMGLKEGKPEVVVKSIRIPNGR